MVYVVRCLNSAHIKKQNIDLFNWLMITVLHYCSVVQKSKKKNYQVIIMFSHSFIGREMIYHITVPLNDDDDDVYFIYYLF